MFYTVNDVPYYSRDENLPDGAKAASAMEAAQCVSRAVYLGNDIMHEVNEEFRKAFGKK